MKAQELIDPQDIGQWWRASGSEYQFCATSAELKLWLPEFLPKTWAPYSFISSRKVGTDEQTPWEPLISTVEDMPLHDNYQCDVSFNHSILSETTSRSFNITTVPNIDAFCSLNGFILLQHGLFGNKGLDRSRIAVVRRVIHSKTQAVRQYDEYGKIFDALKRGIHKRLEYFTIKEFPGGNRQECTHVRMSAGAKQLFESGTVPFSFLPGRKINQD